MTEKDKNQTQESDAWIAKDPGDSIAGVVTDLDVAWSDFRAQHSKDPNGGNYPVIKIKTDDGNTATIHAFRTVLFNEVVKRQPKPGERIVVTFTGYGKAQGSRSAPHLYSLETPERNPDAVAKNVYDRIPGMATPVNEPGDDDIPF